MGLGPHSGLRVAQSVKIFNYCFDHDNHVKQHRYCLKNAGLRAQFESYGRQKLFQTNILSDLSTFNE